MSWQATRAWLGRHGGWLLMGLGVVGAIVEVETLLGYETRSGNHGPIAGFAIAAALLAAGALVQLRRRRLGGRAGASPAFVARPELEPRLLRAAQEKAGRLTASEAALALDLPFDVVNDALAGLAARDACRTLVTEEKVVVYYFPEFEDPSSKRHDITER